MGPGSHSIRLFLLTGMDAVWRKWILGTVLGARVGA